MEYTRTVLSPLIQRLEHLPLQVGFFLFGSFSEQAYGLYSKFCINGLDLEFDFA